jgi:hypothetical protein
MKNLSLFGLCGFLCFLSLTVAATRATADVSAASAPDTHWELTGNTNAYLLISHQTDDLGNPFEANFGTHVGYFVAPQWEVGGRIGFTATSGGNASMWRTSATVTVGPTFNLCKDAANTFFATAQIGLGFYNFADSGNSYLPMAFLAGIGRRIGIVDHVTWSPEFTFSGRVRATNGSSYLSGLTDYELRLFQFSVLL